MRASADDRYRIKKNRMDKHNKWLRGIVHGISKDRIYAHSVKRNEFNFMHPTAFNSHFNDRSLSL